MQGHKLNWILEGRKYSHIAIPDKLVHPAWQQVHNLRMKKLNYLRKNDLAGDCWDFSKPSTIRL